MNAHAKDCASAMDAGSPCTCDGFHTFAELYEHRHRLFIEVCWLRRNVNYVWISQKHHDGSMYDGWFVAGINKAKSVQVTYHLPTRFWDEMAEFAEVMDRAPEWDGHTSSDVLERIKGL